MLVGHRLDCLPRPEAMDSAGRRRNGVGVDQIARQFLHIGGIGQAEADMAGLHLAARPGEHGLAGKAFADGRAG